MEALSYISFQKKWRQRLKAERNELIRQLDIKLTFELNQKSKLEEEKKTILREFDLEKEGHLSLQRKYEQFEQDTDDNLSDFRAKVSYLEKGNQNLRDEKEQLLHKNKQLAHSNEQLNHRREQLMLEKEQLTLENEQLIHRNKQLILENEQLIFEGDQKTLKYEELILKKSALEETHNQVILQLDLASKKSRIKNPKSNKESLQESNNKLDEAIPILLPSLIFLRDSIERIEEESRGFNFLISNLKLINDGDFAGSVKVKATHSEWRECRVQQMNMMRIYFQKCKSAKSQCQVLISLKKNQKSQDRDYEWLKKQSSC